MVLSLYVLYYGKQKGCFVVKLAPPHPPTGIIQRLLVLYSGGHPLHCQCELVSCNSNESMFKQEQRSRWGKYMRRALFDMILRESMSGVYPCLRGGVHVHGHAAYKYTCIRACVYGYIHVYTSIHTCRGTRHRASTDVTPQLPSDLLLSNLGSALPLNHLHTSLVTAPAFIAAITEICELDRAPTIGRVSRFILHYLPLVLSEGSVPKEEEDTYCKSQVSSGSNKFEPSELLPFKMHERRIKVRHFHWILLSLRPQLFSIPWTCKCHFYFWFALCLCRCLLGTH